MRRRWIGAFLGCVLALGCGGAAPPPPERSQVEPSADPTPPRPRYEDPGPLAETEAAFEATVPATLDAPAEVACGWTSDAWSPALGRTTLHLAPDGPPVATVSGAPIADLRAPVGDGPTSVWARLRRNGDEIRGWFGPRAAPLSPARAISVGGFATAGPGAEIHIVSAAPGELLVEPPPSDSVEWPGPHAVALTCDRLSADRVEFDVFDALGVPEEGTALSPRQGSWHPFHRTPDGAVLGSLRFGDTILTHTLYEVERDHDWARVHYRSHGWVYLGWVYAEELSPAGMYGLGIGRGGLRSSRFRCDSALPLVVEIDGARHRVGTLAPGTTLVVSPGDDPVAHFGLDWLHTSPGARFVLPRETLDACDAVSDDEGDPGSGSG